MDQQHDDAAAAQAPTRLAAWRHRALHLFDTLSARSRDNLVVWLGAALVGLVSVALAKSAEWAFEGFARLHAHWWWWPFISLPLGGVLIRLLMTRYGQGAESAGIPQTVASINAAERSDIASHFLNPRVVIAKFGAIVLGIGSGFVMGREGPTVQIGASIMYSCRRWLSDQSVSFHRQLMVTGGAAGIAAAFNTPLAGIVFAFEELTRSVEERTSGKLIGAVILAGVVSLAFLGNYTVFGHLKVPPFAYTIFIPLIPIAILTGLIGGLLSWLCVHPQRWLPGAVLAWRLRRPYQYVIISALIVAALGLLAPIFGSGGPETSAAIASGTPLPWYFLPVKFAGLLTTFLLGLPGGVFAPSLSLGAAAASWLAPLFADDLHTKLMAIGMVGMLAAVTRAPLTAAVIVMEMTDGHAMVISILAASMIAARVARLFNTHLYSELAARTLAPFGYQGKHHD
ncbi:H+/Cl-antiporter ClcA [Andreprevotia lacus DSM 23236]|jgi:H+/Cl- antiporter ClcA|uniref:H+/Cl-antiporter ClcA n=1 Tax=Andreprevotia lacus DSM 23236 TaxID=1121001 RepID=A0A1W1X9Y1_9NEIS|nr:chloride channel protein [Andreprevotia lacus]SMC20746.1 H+/Cl-antiporter ClcA [Andreprevotia lacus DSM 23236]